MTWEGNPTNIKFDLRNRLLMSRTACMVIAITVSRGRDGHKTTLMLIWLADALFQSDIQARQKGKRVASQDYISINKPTLRWHHQIKRIYGHKPATLWALTSTVCSRSLNRHSLSLSSEPVPCSTKSGMYCGQYPPKSDLPKLLTSGLLKVSDLGTRLTQKTRENKHTNTNTGD